MTVSSDCAANSCCPFLYCYAFKLSNPAACLIFINKFLSYALFIFYSPAAVSFQIPSPSHHCNFDHNTDTDSNVWITVLWDYQPSSHIGHFPVCWPIICLPQNAFYVFSQTVTKPVFISLFISAD